MKNLILVATLIFGVSSAKAEFVSTTNSLLARCEVGKDMVVFGGNFLSHYQGKTALIRYIPDADTVGGRHTLIELPDNCVVTPNFVKKTSRVNPATVIHVDAETVLKATCSAEAGGPRNLLLGTVFVQENGRTTLLDGNGETIELTGVYSCLVDVNPRQ